MSKIGNLKKEKTHILIYAGRFSGATNENRELVDQGVYPDLALLAYSKLKKIDKNVILYTDNDTVRYETMEKIVFIGDSKKVDFEGIQKKAVDYKIPFIILANDTNVENYCNSLRQKDFSA